MFQRTTDYRPISFRLSSYLTAYIIGLLSHTLVFVNLKLCGCIHGSAHTWLPSGHTPGNTCCFYPEFSCTFRAELTFKTCCRRSFSADQLLFGFINISLICTTIYWQITNLWSTATMNRLHGLWLEANLDLKVAYQQSQSITHPPRPDYCLSR